MRPIDFNGLDTAVHGPIRLGALTALQTEGPLDFTTLKKRLNVADGAMGIHLRKLEDIGYIACKKSFVGRRPRSTYRITSKGRRALRGYLDAMQHVIDAVEEAQKTS
ncbi:MAG: winged helix-turn-helix domain-containing protein [Planctomycetota bacterium]|jgi:DNA-binding MarR family transcriptional regulator